MKNVATKGESDRVDDPAESLMILCGLQVRLTQAVVMRTLETQLAPLGVSPQRYLILLLADRHPGLAQSRIAEALGIDRSTLVPSLDRMETKGLVERRATAGDLRSKSIYLKPAGAALLRKVQPIIDAHEDRLLRGIDVQERVQLTSLLTRIRENLSGS